LKISKIKNIKKELEMKNFKNYILKNKKIRISEILNFSKIGNLKNWKFPKHLEIKNSKN
jgi:hypothetical protein